MATAPSGPNGFKTWWTSWSILPKKASLTSSDARTRKVSNAGQGAFQETQQMSWRKRASNFFSTKKQKI